MKSVGLEGLAHELQDIVDGQLDTGDESYDNAVRDGYNELGATLRKWELLHRLRYDVPARGFTTFYVEILEVCERHGLECGGDLNDMLVELHNVLNLLNNKGLPGA